MHTLHLNSDSAGQSQGEGSLPVHLEHVWESSEKCLIGWTLVDWLYWVARERRGNSKRKNY